LQELFFGKAILLAGSIVDPKNIPVFVTKKKGNGCMFQPKIRKPVFFIQS